MRVLRTTMILAFIATGAFAEVYVDAALATGANDGTSWANAYQGAGGLQAAIDDGSGDIHVAAGTYDAIVLASGAVVLGGFNNGDALADRDPVTKVAIIDGGGAATCVVADAVQNTVLDGFTLQNGVSTVTVGTATVGGGIFARSLDATNTMQNLVVRNCSATGSGGGLYLTASTLVLADCVFDNNTTGGSGGGAYIGNCAGLTVSDCAFTNNETTAASTHGGGASVVSGTVVLSGCTVADNVAVAGGGGVFTMSANFTATGCTFSGNKGSWIGGGLCMNAEGPWTVTDCTFIGNSAQGGGLRISGNNTANDTATVSGCTFTDNVGAGNSASGIHLNANDAVLVTDCVITGGTGTRGAILVDNCAKRQKIVNCLLQGNAGSIGALFVAGPADVVNCTLAGNTATNQTVVVWGSNSKLNMLNCVVWGNQDHTETPALDFGSWSGQDAATAATVNYCDFERFPGLADYDPNPFALGTGNVSVDPQFFDKANKDYRLHFLSPVLDAGDAADPLTPDHDLLGDPRPGTVAGVSMGAYEEGAMPASVPVPDVGGMSQEDAIAALEALGFNVVVVTEYSDTTPEGEIVGTNPPAGTDAPPGSTVELIISDGPPPPFVGVPAAGVAALIALGLALAVFGVRRTFSRRA